MVRILILAAIFATAPQAEASRSSKACFAPDEVKAMITKRDTVSKAAAQCLNNYWNTHLQFYKANRYSKYFGNRNKAIENPDKRALAIFLVYKPDFIPEKDLKDMRAITANKIRQKNSKSDDLTPGLYDLEVYMQAHMPEKIPEYMQLKQQLRLVERAQDEKGREEGKRGSDLRGNTNMPMQNISCVDMTRRCLRAGFQAAGMEATFEKVDAEVRATDLSGVEMQKALSDLGWKILFFNPDPSQNAAWDQDDQKILPLRPAAPCVASAETKCPPAMVWQGAWGGHETRTKGVMNKDEYYLGKEKPLKVDDKKLLVGFGTEVPAEFKAVPFWIGTAHSGYHVFPGFSGRIIEAHSMRAIKSVDNLEMSVFNPLDQGNHGGPRWTNTEHYRSGIIAVPPGYLDTSLDFHTPNVDDQGCVDLHSK